MRTPSLFVIMLAVSLSVLVLQDRSVGETTAEKKRDQELFLQGAKAISEGKYDQGRILLNTMIYTYTESTLVNSAKLLVFYSYAREGGPKNEKATRLLKEIEEQMKTYEIKQRVNEG